MENDKKIVDFKNMIIEVVIYEDGTNNLDFTNNGFTLSELLDVNKKVNEIILEQLKTK